MRFSFGSDKIVQILIMVILILFVSSLVFVWSKMKDYHQNEQHIQVHHKF